MVQLGIRKFKSGLSRYMQLVKAGKSFAIQSRNETLGYLVPQTNISVEPLSSSQKDLEKRIQKLKDEGLLLSGGGPYKYRPFTPIKMTPGPSSTEIIRQMRDED